jgi:hypothetical protein
MRTFYYVNGKKVDLQTYLEAGVTNDHNRKMVKLAREYYKKHPKELEKAYLYVQNSPFPKDSLFTYYSYYTEEGKKMNEEFSRNKDKLVNKEFRYGCYAQIFIIILCILFIYFGCF